jgi:SWI/SNF-related matrix-associated actin-dependent regulator 1 of chromatin subfamily A
MAKKKQEDKEKEVVVVKIRKLKVNFELRYDFLKILSEYIKRLPKEHRKVRKDSVIGMDGKPKDDWVRTVSDAKIGEIITFLIDNKIRFVFENITPDVVQRLKEQYLERQRKISEVLKLKAEQLDVSGEDYSFMKIQPYEYQKKAVKFFEINDGKAILGDQPGVGKSCPSMSYAAKYKLKTLIICPASLKLMWKKEILRFTNEKAFIYKFKPKKKSKIIIHTKEESLFHIVNYESVETYIKLEYKHKCSGKMLQPSGGIAPCDWQQIDLTKKYTKCPICENTGTIKSSVHGLVGFQDDFHQELNPEDYDLIIIDECHRIKELSTSWTKIIHKALKIIPKKILLSGTVIKSRPIEFFSSLNFVFPEEWKNSHEFGVRYCAGYESGYGWDYSGASNLEELFTRASSYFLRRLKRDVLSELPEKTYMEIPIELTDVEYREYKKLEEAVKKVIVNGKEIEKEETFLEKVHKLKLFTGKVKLSRVIEMIEDIISTGEKVVVISDYQEVAKGVYEAFKSQAVLHTGSMSDEDKQNSVDLFQEDPKIKVFSGMVIASGVGLTLTAASKMYRIGFPWTPSECEQVEDRIHRASTTADTIEIITLICQDTIDEDIDELLRDKAYIVTKTLDNKEYKKEAITYNESVYKELLKRLKEK